MRRHQVPRSGGGGGVYGLSDLVVGSSVSVYGREVHLVDADPFTRAFFNDRGAPLAPALPYPDSPLDQYRAARSKPSGDCSRAAAIACSAPVPPSQDSPELLLKHLSSPPPQTHMVPACAAGLSRSDPDSPSQYAEALLGREHNSKSLQQFLQHGGEVLRFFAVWDDRAAPYGDRHFFKLHFFVADSTVSAGGWGGRGGGWYVGVSAGGGGASEGCWGGRPAAERRGLKSCPCTALPCPALPFPSPCSSC